MADPGAVRFRITRLTGPNAVISGVFFDTPGAPGNVPPTVTLDNPTGGPWTAPATVGLRAIASDSDGTISQVRFYNGATLIGTSPNTSSPYTFNWLNVAAGTYSITAQATDSGTATTISAPVTVTVTAPGGGPLASYVGTDAATQGTWKPIYGVDGRALATVGTTNPVYGPRARVATSRGCGRRRRVLRGPCNNRWGVTGWRRHGMARRASRSTSL